MVSTRLQSTSGVESGNDYSGAGPSRFSRHGTSSNDINTYSQPPSTQYHPYVSTTHFLDLPSECMDKIFGYLGYKKVSHLRLVCKQLDRVCGAILNSTFQKLQTQMLHRFQGIKAKMPRRESARRNHPLACESDIVETLHMRLTLLQMSFGKHIERRHICFFPGEILDEVYRILHYIKVTPKLARPYKVTDELFDLSTMAMEYFKEHIEPTLPEIAYFGTDFLDYTVTNNKYLTLDSPPHGIGRSDESVPTNQTEDNTSRAVVQQTHIMLRKRIRKMKQTLKRYNDQVSQMRKELRCNRTKLADNQKQLVEFASRFDEYDKKTEETNRKFSTMLQELNKCKTELQYWRSKSPLASVCGSCGQVNAALPDQLRQPEFLPDLPEPDIDIFPMDHNDGWYLQPIAGPSSPPLPPPLIPAPAAEQRNKRKSSVPERSTGAPPNKKQRGSLKRSKRQ